jgi:hypothetical protein
MVVLHVETPNAGGWQRRFCGWLFRRPGKWL